MVRSVSAFRTLTSTLLVSASRCFSPSSLSRYHYATIASTCFNRAGATTKMTMSSTSTTPSVTTSTTTITTDAFQILPENLQAVANLEPKSLWTHFAALSSIPRPSKKEQGVINYIKSLAQAQNLKWKQDAVGNLVVFHPGAGIGHDKDGTVVPPVILQGHVDMVTEKNSDTIHDFEKDPILLELVPRNDGSSSSSSSSTWLTARGTTLGADNGIGVAAALAILGTSPEDPNANFPPIQALFTVDEETGLTGATDLDAQALGLTAKTMLNLDTEEWGELYVGCAGGGESIIQLPLQRVNNNNNNNVETSVNLVEIRVEGLMGGHSGINIHEGRANAVLLCAGTIQAAIQQHSDENIALVSFTGGDKHNAIPREARAVLALSSSEPGIRYSLEKVVEQCAEAAKAEFGILETNLRIRIQDYVSNASSSSSTCLLPLDSESTSRLLSMILGLPHGPIKFSHAMPDLVETSNNVASLTMTADEATLLCSTRSSIRSALDSARDKLSAVAYLAGAKIIKSDPYPGWNPNMKSPLLQMTKELLTKKTGKTPGIKAIHAGLECGLLIEKLGGNVDTLSFGPTITGAHSPDEQIDTDTVPPFYELVQDILAELAQKRN